LETDTFVLFPEKIGNHPGFNLKPYGLMIRTLTETEFYCGKLDEEKQIFISEWKETSRNMNEYDFQQNLLLSIEAFHSVGMDKVNILADSQKFLYSQTPESVQWASELISQEMMENHVEMMAVVLPQKIFQSMTISKAVSTINKIGGGELMVRNFGSVRDAENWLMAHSKTLKSV